MKKQSEQNLFSTDHLKTDIKKKSLKGGAVTLTSQGLTFIIQMGAGMILARILTPHDYGLMAMVFAVTGLAAVLNNLGLSTATVQSAEINQAQVSNLFWLNVGMGVIVMLVVAALAPALAWFYKAPALTGITLALASTFLLSGLGTQHRALLNRQMQFVTIAKIDISALAVGFIVAIILAYYGAGYWALVANSIVSTSMNTLLTWFSVRWCPMLPQRETCVRTMLKFGADVAGFNVINYFARNLDNVLIGRYCGGAELGLYNKAYQLLMMPITNLREPMVRVAMPALSSLQHDPEQYRSYYKKYIEILAIVSMPLIVLMYIYSDQIIYVLLGPQWLEASALFKILAIAALIQPVGTSWGLVMLSTGNSRLYLRWGVVNSCITCLSFFCGLPWGAKGVAISYAVVTYLLLYPSLFLGFRNTPVKMADFGKAIWRPLVASFIMGVVCYVLSSLVIFNMPSMLTLFISGILGIFAYLIVLYLLNYSNSSVYEYIRNLNNLFERGI